MALSQKRKQKIILFYSLLLTRFGLKQKIIIKEAKHVS